MDRILSSDAFPKALFATFRRHCHRFGRKHLVQSRKKHEIRGAHSKKESESEDGVGRTSGHESCSLVAIYPSLQTPKFD
jgi:hypothetical protein